MQGTLERENTVLFVSRGIGMVYVPVRLNCPPEWPCSRWSAAASCPDARRPLSPAVFLTHEPAPFDAPPPARTSAIAAG